MSTNPFSSRTLRRATSRIWIAVTQASADVEFVAPANPCEITNTRATTSLWHCILNKNPLHLSDKDHGLFPVAKKARAAICDPRAIFSLNAWPERLR
jgi:hypothetical protein